VVIRSITRVFLPWKQGTPNIQDYLAVSTVMHSEQAISWTAIMTERNQNSVVSLLTSSVMHEEPSGASI